LGVIALAVGGGCGGLADANDGGANVRDSAAPDGPSKRDSGSGEGGMPEGGSDTNPDTGPCGAEGAGLVTLASAQPLPLGLAVDSTSVYWTDAHPSAKGPGPLDGTVMKVALCGGAPTTLATGDFRGRGVAADATSVYWTNSGGTVMKVPLNGGKTTTLASTFGDANQPAAIAVDATSVYWTNVEFGCMGDGGCDSNLMSVPLGGGAATTLLSGQSGGNAIALDTTSVYWPTSSLVLKVPLGGGAAVTLDPGGVVEPWAIAVDSTSVYLSRYTCSGDGGDCPVAVLKLPLDGGTPTTLASAPSWSIQAITVDATSLYWAACMGACNLGSNNGLVMKVPLEGGTLVTLASGQAVPSAIVVDATSVYWTDFGNGSGTLMKLTPK
jgi:hypothetical protein